MPNQSDSPHQKHVVKAGQQIEASDLSTTTYKGTTGPRKAKRQLEPKKRQLPISEINSLATAIKKRRLSLVAVNASELKLSALHFLIACFIYEISLCLPQF